MDTTHTTNAARKGIKCADLAVSAWGLGNEDECYYAAARAGALTHTAGYTLEHLAKDAPQLLQCGNAWSVAVDAFYDAVASV